MPLVVSDGCVTDGVAAYAARVDDGVLQVRTGPAPEEADASPSGTLLVAFDLEDPAFAAATGPGVRPLDGLPMTEPGGSTGTAGHVRLVNDSDGGEMVGNCRSANDSDQGEIAVLNTTSIQEDVDVTLLACRLTLPTGPNGS